MSHSLESALKRLKGMYLVAVLSHLDNEIQMYVLFTQLCQLQFTKCVFVCVYVCLWLHVQMLVHVPCVLPPLGVTSRAGKPLSHAEMHELETSTAKWCSMNNLPSTSCAQSFKCAQAWAISHKYSIHPVSACPVYICRYSTSLGNNVTIATEALSYGNHGVLPYAICRDDPEKKMATTLKVHKWHARNVCVRLVNGLHEPYQALSSASMGNRTVNFAGKHR